MILRDFHEILQKFQSLDEADIVDNKIGNQEEGQEDQQTEEMVVSEDVRAAQVEEELLQRTEEEDEIDVAEELLDEDLDGGEHLEVTEHLTEGDGGDYPSDSGKSDENKRREDILQVEEKKADEKEREGNQDLNTCEDELKEEREIEADTTKPTVESSKNEKSKEHVLRIESKEELNVYKREKTAETSRKCMTEMLFCQSMYIYLSPACLSIYLCMYICTRTLLI